ncbi:hypothetical protein CVV38_01070 [Candidatus Peregrinibacteria bacterium HGW-Peregrinibacteria-1]|jgi:GNAT superfamily N-acetyltransferase|nr:MAG: hypothetical protein CVV38_01070 [Candidatus Peregrinibacteria bacterium HGW-Peregrinibacteria-1]
MHKISRLEYRRQKEGDAIGLSGLAEKVIVTSLASCYSELEIKFLLERNSKENLLKKLENRVFHIAEDKISKEIIGAIAVRDTKITFFAVDPKFQKQGIGKKLFSLVKEKVLFVHAAPVAVPIYLNLGFKVKGNVKEAIPGGELESVLMTYHAA